MLSLIWSHISTFGSVLDILLVAFLIYQFLSLVRGTRAAPMLVGVATLGLAFYFARLGELRTLNWLLSTLLPYVVFALIVVFQSEIRHALANLGSRSFLMRSSNSAADVYDDIVLAANLFSQNQTGALIVIEREIGLRTYIESGVALDARLSYDLLATVFRPSAPLHDGAVIVQRDRIAAAACFLPLSMNPVLSTQLGTRHRAGIGITEETDAVAVIVSEETGTISLAVGGTIERELSVERLRERLGHLLRRYAPAPRCRVQWKTALLKMSRQVRWLRGSKSQGRGRKTDDGELRTAQLSASALLHNFGLKLVSILLAIGLWMAVARDPIAEVEIKVPIEFHNLADNLEIDSANFTEAQIRVRGPERLIHRLGPADVRADIDLANVQSRRTDFRSEWTTRACAAGSRGGADHPRAISFLL